jgi:hypothetical protein
MDTITNALWTWNTTDLNNPFVTGYYNNTPTKTGLLPNAVRQFAGVPLVKYGKPSTPVSDEEIFEFLRSAEDDIEQESGILLTPTMVASPPTRSAQQSLAAGIIGRAPNGGQQQGCDFDLMDAPYDFKFDRAREDGWLIQSMRYKPLRIYDDSITAIKRLSYVYPLLNQFFTIPTTWLQEDLDFAILRVVPSVNVTLLPLFALQLAVQGFSDSVPGGMWYWYSAGLSQNDYATRFRFIKQLVLCESVITALSVCQGTVNQGLESSAVLTDGVQTQYKYRQGGAYADLIKRFKAQRDDLMAKASMAVGGFNIEVL